jgi:hypothetical protein
MVNRLISTALGVIGGIMGGIFGSVLFFWIARQEVYAWVLPGAAVGLGCGLLARHKSVLRGFACAIAALALGLYTERMLEPLVDDRFRYLVMHLYEKKPIALILIGLGAALAFYLGMQAGFLAPRSDNVSSTAGGSAVE